MQTTCNAYGLTDAAPSSHASVQLRMVEPNGTGLSKLSWEKAIKQECFKFPSCMEYPKLSGPSCKGRLKMTWMEVISSELRELGICKEGAADRAMWKRLIGPVDRGMLDGW